LQYKVPYDLLSQASASTASPRKTRRAHTERLQLLKGGSTSAHVGASLSAGTTTKKGPPPVRTESAEIWNILASAKGKGKEKEKERPEKRHHLHLEEDGSSDGLPSTTVAHRGWKGRGKSVSAHAPRVNQIDSSTDDLDTSISTLHINQARAYKRSVIDSTPQSISANGHSPSFPRKRRKTESSVDHHTPPSSPDVIPSPMVSARSTTRPRASLFLPPEIKLRVMPSRSVAPRAEPGPPPFISSIKRIKLLVRPPPPSFSHPRQRPPEAKYGGSLKDFLTSYSTLDGLDFFDEDEVEDAARKEAELRERIDTFRRAGRLFLLPDAKNGSPSPSLGHTRHTSTSTPTSTSSARDPWARVVDTVVARSKMKRVDGKHVAGQIAAKTKAYWDGYAAREDRARALEDKRLRALAKSTVKVVVAEWKKALFVSWRARNYERSPDPFLSLAYPRAG
jgi:helicase SWR1